MLFCYGRTGGRVTVPFHILLAWLWTVKGKVPAKRTLRAETAGMSEGEGSRKKPESCTCVSRGTRLPHPGRLTSGELSGGA